MEQELLEEFMAAVEERWQALAEALELQRLRHDPDALPLADALPWASYPPGGAPGSWPLPAEAREWAAGFVSFARAKAAAQGPASELLCVIEALTLEEGARLRAYLQEAYDRPKDIGAAALVDDALFAAQDLRRGAG